MLQTIPDMFFDRVERHPDRVAHATRVDGDKPSAWARQTWREYGDRVRDVARSLLAAGVTQGDRIAILASNRPEWLHVDMASMSIGAVPLGIYTTSSPEQLEYLLDHSGARLLVLEDESHYERLASRLKSLEKLNSIVTMPGRDPGAPAVTSWDEFLDRGRSVPARDVDEHRGRLQPSDLGSLVYTSGTTGPPKAVMLSHANLVETARMGVQAIVRHTEKDRAISYLPLAHVAERGISLLGPVAGGYAVYFCRQLEYLPRYLRDVRPTIFVGVPRLWEKMYETIRRGLEDPRGLAARMASWALGGTSSPGTPEGLRGLVARRLIGPSLRKKIGLDQAHTAVSGSAPLSPDIIEFFGHLGIEIREIYGLSECGGPATFVRPGRGRLGTVGQPFEGAELRIAEDGEILIRGSHVFAGYLDDATATESALRDGWLHSGDLGEIDGDRYLRITGRKKEMIITAGGKNIAPRHIEGMLAHHALVRDVMVVGDGKKFLTALFTFSRDGLTGLADEGSSWDSEATRESAVAVLQRHVSAVNDQLARAEQIKRFAVLRSPFSEESGELTPTKKLRRSFVCQKYAYVIERLYLDTDERHTGFVAIAEEESTEQAERKP